MGVVLRVKLMEINSNLFSRWLKKFLFGLDHDLVQGSNHHKLLAWPTVNEECFWGVKAL